jgi:predicted O-linked N-acetylglucosamine transferase (SPINDLY family)
MGDWRVELSSVIKGLQAGQAEDHSQLRRLLTVGSKEDRYVVNSRLAAAYYDRYEQLGDRKSLNDARACIDRALLLSRYSVDVLPLLIQINRALDDVDAIRNALKRTGIESASRGEFDAALNLFDRWIYANSEFKGNDIHSFDADVIACVERMGALHRFPRGDNKPVEGRKLRLAYLTHGVRQPGSVLIKIDRAFAHLHDKSRFDVAYFSADDPTDISATPDAQTAINDFRDAGCQFFLPPETSTNYERLLGVGQQIHDFGADVLVTSAGLASFQNYLIASLRPAPVTIALNQGSTPQFSWHSFDHTINWFLTTLPDCPCDCSHVPLELDLPRSENITPISRAQLEIPTTATILAAGGRWHKFQRPEFWQVISTLLSQLDDLYFVVLGINEDQVTFLDDIVTPEARGKIRFKPWGQDYLAYLAAADLVVDSYPMGGGVLLMEAMSLGLPVLSFHHDYVAYYRNDDCSGGEEIVGIEDLLIERGNFDELKDRIAGLVHDPDRRRRLGEQCRQLVQEKHSNPARMVQRCESIYERVFRERQARSQQDVAAQLVNSHEPALDEYKRLLLEQATILNNREGEIRRLETQRNGHPLKRVVRRLRGELYRLRAR